MKTLKSFIVLSVLLLVSCNSDYNESKYVDKKRSNNNGTISISSLVYQSGLIHNTSLGYVNSIWDTTLNIQLDSNISKLCQLTNGFTQENYNFDSTYLYDLNYNFISECIKADDFHNEFLDGLNNILNSDFYLDSITITEKDLISAGLNIFNGNFLLLNHTEIADFIINKSDSLLNLWETINWDTSGSYYYIMRSDMNGMGPNGSGNLSFGFLDIINKSASYWKENDFDPDGPNLPFINVIQIDAAGYIVGWISACVEEQRRTGKISLENMDKRIQAGIDEAMKCSLGYYLLKAVGL